MQLPPPADASHTADASTARPKVSEQILAIFRDSPGDRVTLREVVHGLGDRGFGILFVFLALPNVIPIPGISTVVGIPMAIFAAQMLFGLREPWLPKRLLDQSFGKAEVMPHLTRAIERLARVERWIKPRLPSLTTPMAERAIGAVILYVAMVLCLPIAGANLIPAIGVVCFALGIIEKDGVMVLIGGAMTVLTTLYLLLVLYLGVQAIAYLLRWFL
ncbi:MAG: exopolysaccharide biosynthesis protein [Alphaproteobacteria bacterium]|nr:exopolysaccharide biosynthesis protein [Alphaproteobacteria bacterium]